MEKETEQELIKRMIGFQKEEITSSIIYRKLAAKEKNLHNREILQRIAEDESRHYATLRGYTHQDVVLIVLKSALCMVSASAGCYICGSSSGTGRERNEWGIFPIPEYGTLCRDGEG